MVGCAWRVAFDFEYSGSPWFYAVADNARFWGFNVGLTVFDGLFIALWLFSGFPSVFSVCVCVQPGRIVLAQHELFLAVILCICWGFDCAVKVVYH